jgi:pimeloyl-ACP methyl ester carboxylesterase
MVNGVVVVQKISRRTFGIAAAGIAAGSYLLEAAPPSFAITPYTVSTYTTGGVFVRKFLPEGPAGRPAIIMVHGGMQAGWAWDRYARYFAGRGWECHVLDWYHHGSSIQLAPQTFVARSITAVAQEIEAVMTHVGRSRPVVFMGHSMGGLASLHAATFLGPRALVLITPVLPTEVGAAVLPISVNLSVPVPVPPFAVAKSFFFATMPDAEAMTYYQRLVPESARAVWEASRWTVSVPLSEVGMPTMTVAAGVDTITPAPDIRRLASLLPNCDHLDVPDLGHSDVLLKAPGWQPVALDIDIWLQLNT